MNELFQAIQAADVQGVRVYLESGQSIAIKNEFGQSPLQVALASGNPMIIQLLIEQKANFCAVAVPATTPEQ